MRICTIVALIALAASVESCARRGDPDARNTRQDQTAGEKAGKAAYWASKRAEKAVKKAAQDLNKAAQQAHQGWREAAREDRSKRDRDGSTDK